MDIAALSMGLNQGKLQQQVSLSVMKLAMGEATTQGNFVAAMANEVSKTMELSVHPYRGTHIDIQV